MVVMSPATARAEGFTARLGSWPFFIQHKEIGYFSNLFSLKTDQHINMLFIVFQVKHLQSVISLESDFVSPENVSQSFFMYRQLRHLCDSQKQPIDDKLYVKNLIFHSVKNAVATLERSKSSNGNAEDSDENEENDPKSDKE